LALQWMMVLTMWSYSGWGFGKKIGFGLDFEGGTLLDGPLKGGNQVDP